MMSKKQIREHFRDVCMKRDGYRCVMCKAKFDLQVHHIIDRNDMPNGGYVLENGITVCAECHVKCEAEHNNQIPEPGFSRAELFEKIGSSRAKAIKASEKL